MSGSLAGRKRAKDGGEDALSAATAIAHPLDQLLIDLNLRLLTGQAERRALEASYEEAGLLVDDEGRVTLLRLP